MTISKLYHIEISVNSLHGDSDRVIGETNQQITKLNEYFFSNEIILSKKDANTTPSCAGWGFTAEGFADNLCDAHKAHDKLKYFISQNCNHLFVE